MKSSIFIVVAALAYQVSEARYKPEQQRRILQLPRGPGMRIDFNKPPLSKDEDKVIGNVILDELRKDLNADDLAVIATYYAWQNPSIIPKNERNEEVTVDEYHQRTKANSQRQSIAFLYNITSDFAKTVNYTLDDFNNERNETELTKEEYETLAEKVKTALRNNPSISEYVKMTGEYFRKYLNEFMKEKDYYEREGVLVLTVNDFLEHHEDTIRMQEKHISRLSWDIERFIKHIDKKLAEYEKQENHTKNKSENSKFEEVF